MNIHCLQIKIEQHYFWVNTYYSHDNNFQRFTNSFLSCLFTFFSLSIPRYLAVYNSIWECYAHIIIHIIYYMNMFILRSRSFVRTFSLFMYQMSWAWNCILLDVQLAFTMSPTLYSCWRPEICGPSSNALPCATRK